MQLEERLLATEDLLLAADKDLDAGNYVQASENLWGAVTEATQALAHQQGRAVGDYGEMLALMREMQEAGSRPDLRAALIGAEILRANIHHRFMGRHEDFELPRQIVHEYVDTIFVMVNNANNWDVDKARSYT